MTRSSDKRDWWLAGLSLALLALGVLVYVVDRAPGTAAALPTALSMYDGSRSWFGALGGSLPTFVHALGFSLLTALVLPRTRRHAALACGGWALIETAFEVGQHKAVSPLLAAWIAPAAGSVPGADTLRRYFLVGGFDPWDIAAGLAGAAAAYFILRRFLRDARPGETAHGPHPPTSPQE
jgi:hypothetical protein